MDFSSSVQRPFMKSSAGMGGATSLSLMRWRQRAHQYELVHLDLQSGSEESIGDQLFVYCNNDEHNICCQSRINRSRISILWCSNCLLSRLPRLSRLQQQTQTARTARIIKTQEAWVAQVKTLYPGYNGTYPRMQLWHETTDSFVFYTGS